MTAEPSPNSGKLNAEAVALIKQAWASYDEQRGVGFMSCAIYDTAWVSMVSREIDGETTWLFPESFDYLIKNQSDDGSWGITNTSQIDGILNTGASLLSLKKHQLQPGNSSKYALENINKRIEKARFSLCSQLVTWDVARTSHVGFEMIMPTLLDLLRFVDDSFIFRFPGENTLKEIHDKKLARFSPTYLYGPEPSTALHSLEAFIGHIDFAKVAHHKVGGSMMGSPSSTAAYLIHSTTWDVEAEDYLRYVIQAGRGRGTGAVPSAYPSTFFEYSWVLSTLLRSGFSVADLDCPELSGMRDLLYKGFNDKKCKIGFASCFPEDVDDTAKCIISLSKLGMEASPLPMIEAFDAVTHFRTYASERNPSFTANCNVLSALLQQPNMSLYYDAISRVTRYLCHCWWSSDQGIKDKWNISPLYPSLLLVQAFTDLLDHIQQGRMKPLNSDLHSRVCITVFQACFRALTGSCSRNSVEDMAYRLLVLCEMRRLPFLAATRAEMETHITDLAHLLSTVSEIDLNSKSNNLWVEKVNFGSPILTQSYRLAALKAVAIPAVPISLSSDGSAKLDLKKNEYYLALLQKTQLLASIPKWQLQASLVEAVLFQPLLRRRRLNIFPRENLSPDRYFDLIPFTWTACNNKNSIFASTQFIYEMMVISFLDFQADEFMEITIGDSFGGNSNAVRELIDEVFATTECRELLNANTNFSDSAASQFIDERSHVSDESPVASAQQMKGPNIEESQHLRVRLVLGKFVGYIMNHPSVLSCSPWDRVSLFRELRIYLHAHVTQSELSAQLSHVQSMKKTQSSLSDHAVYSAHTALSNSYFRWVRTTSGDHTACPYSFAFAGCLLSSQCGGLESFPSSRAKYLAGAMSQHLSAMCRMYNDYGSVARDDAESNLNSVDFPEFARSPSRIASTQDLSDRKKKLLQLAEYERIWLTDVMQRLDDEMHELGLDHRMNIWHLFRDVTDLYGEIYIVKDIASGKTNGAQKTEA